jgi:hypothetical protein
MVYILLFVIVILLMIVAFLGFQNSKIKQQHYSNMEQLQGIISSLHQKQMLLKDKVTIATEYNANYSKDMKNIGDEVVELQKVFLEIISNKKNN